MTPASRLGSCGSVRQAGVPGYGKPHPGSAQWYFALWVFSTRRMSPCVTLASTRCRPQAAFGEPFGTGVPSFDVIFRNDAPPSVEHSPLNAAFASIHGVDTCGSGNWSNWMPAAISVPGANGFDGIMLSRSITPPCSAAGLVQSTWRPALVVRPNNELSGGVSL